MAKRKVSRKRSGDRLDVAREAYFAARRAADEAWIEYIDYLRSAVSRIKDALASDRRPVPDLERRIDEMRANAESAEATAQDAYQEYMEAWQEFQQETQEVVYG